MFRELVEATKKVLEKDFVDYEMFSKNNKRGFEVAWSKLVFEELKRNVPFKVKNLKAEHSVSGKLKKRRFDLAWNLNDHLNVCEIGHEKSSRGYLNNNNGNPNNMGLINKWFFDYCRNYYQPFPALNPRSYSYLYFTLENGYDKTQMEKMFDFIKKVADSVNLKCECIDVFKDGRIKGKIIIIDAVNDFKKVRDMYQQNTSLHCFVNHVEVFDKKKKIKWNKHDLLMGKIEDPYIFP